MTIRLILVSLLAFMQAAHIALPARAEAECSLSWQNISICFDIDWQTATVEDMADVDVKMQDRDGQTALMWAARWNDNPELIRALIATSAAA